MSHLLLLLAALLVALSAGAVEIEWVLVGDPGNPPDTAANCLNDAPDCGSVDHAYYISKYEITNAQYAEFLNAVAGAADPDRFDSLYDRQMGSDDLFGGITLGGSAGNFHYSVKPGFEDKPVVFVDFYDALRFANWLHNGQPTGAQGASTTEGGAYTITADGISDNTITRSPGALVSLPSENEWYKAAYYDGLLGGYHDYPTGTDTPPTCADPNATPDTANCQHEKLFSVTVTSWSEVPPRGAGPAAGKVTERQGPPGRLVTVDVAGSVSLVRGDPFGLGLVGGESVSGSFAYETTTPPTATLHYVQTHTTYQFDVDGVRFEPEPAEPDWSVEIFNDVPGGEGDSWALEAGELRFFGGAGPAAGKVTVAGVPSPAAGFRIAARDSTGTVFSYASLPDPFPPFGSFDSVDAVFMDAFTTTSVGDYTASEGPYGTFDQGGNVAEWNEGIGLVCISFGCAPLGRGIRGGDWFSGPAGLAADARGAGFPTVESDRLGFRVATVPEPAQVLLVLTGGLVLVAARRRRQPRR
jgi:formylglycine-generating enzyme required for sulfatase activity